MRRQGFTLIELLTVIGVLALLGGLAFVGAQAVQAYVHQAQCASNLRQIGHAVQLFAHENGGRLPRSTHGGPISQSWIFTLAPYLEDVDEVRVCPADPRADDIVENDGTSYVLNEYLVVPRTDYSVDPVTGVPTFTVEDFSLLANLPSPASTFLAFPRADSFGGGTGNTVSTTQDHTHSRSWFNWGAVLRDIQPDRHGDDANYLFADGHVDSIPAADLRARIDRGENFAQPGGG
ncbi:MAG: prepilin-type N-terminal cleavage/methylation domain-containing protein [Opitutales bacterium]